MSPTNIALEIDQDNRAANDRAALEHKIDRDSFIVLQTTARLDGLRGEAPAEPNSDIYWNAYCDGLRVYWSNLKEAEFNSGWEDLL